MNLLRKIGSRLREMLDRRISLWWDWLCVRRSEFYYSLDMDFDALMQMTEEEREQYYEELAKRRAIAHSRDEAHQDAKIFNIARGRK